MNIEGKAVLVTGANRGIGKALVEEFLRRGARKVYAGSRQPMTHPDKRVTPLILDVTNEGHIKAVLGKVESLDILVNNAGVAQFDDLRDPTVLERNLAVNLFGTYKMIRAFVPLLTLSKGAIVNINSIASLAGMPLMPSYSISKAAGFSLTQSARALLAGRGVKVYAVLPGPVDTDMSRDLNIPKFSPESVAQATLNGLENGDEEIFPDPVSESLAEGWRAGVAKGLERQFKAFLAEPANA